MIIYGICHAKDDKSLKREEFAARQRAAENNEKLHFEEKIFKRGMKINLI